MANTCLEVNVNIPFQSERLAKIAFDVLRVDSEPKRSSVTKELSIEGNLLRGRFTANSGKQIRVGVNCFFENVSLILQTFEFAGPPTSEKYSHS